MKAVRYARRASADLEDIADFTAHSWGIEQARRYISAIRARIDEILAGQANVQPVNTGRANLFKARVNRHLILFEETDDQILIVRVLHEAMDIPRHVGPPRSPGK